MSSINTTQIDGDLSIRRDVAIGGMLTAQGTVQFKGRVKVDGWLDAPNIKGPNKGLFETEDALKGYYPHPKNGWWAMRLIEEESSDEYVLGEIYIAYAGEWRATGKSAKIDIEMTLVQDKLDDLSEAVIAAQQTADEAQGAADDAQKSADEAMEAAKEAQATADMAIENNEATQKEVDEIKEELKETPQFNLIKDGNFSKWFREIYDWQSSLKDAVVVKDKRFGWSMFSPKEVGGVAANGSKSILAEGQKYTLSFYAWGKGVAGLQVRQGLSEVIAQDFVGADIDNSKEAQRTIITFTATALSYLSFYKEIEGELWLAHVKLEEGDRATQWMPHRSEIDLATPIIAIKSVTTATEAYEKAEQALSNSEQALTTAEKALESTGGNGRIFDMDGVADSRDALASTNPEAGGIYWINDEKKFVYVMDDGNITDYDIYNNILDDALFRCGDDLYHYNDESGELERYADMYDLSVVENNIMVEVNNVEQTAEEALEAANEALSKAKGLIYYEVID